MNFLCVTRTTQCLFTSPGSQDTYTKYAFQFEAQFLAQRNHDEENGFLTARDNNDVPIKRIRKGHQRNSSCNVCICIVACGSVGASFESVPL